MDQVQADTAPEGTNLATVVDELFANHRTEFPISNGVMVKIKPAKVKQIAIVMRLFNDLLSNIPKEKFEAFLDEVAVEQRRLIGEGKSAYDLDAGSALLLNKALGEHSLILGALASVADSLPSFVAEFTSLTVDEIGELDLDEFVVTLAGVIAVNYGFFTQSLRPIVSSAIAGWKSKKSAQV